MTLPVILVATPAWQTTVRAIATSLPLVGLIDPTRGRWSSPPLPVMADLDLLPSLSPGIVCCFLSPYPRLKGDVQRVLSQGLHVLCAGPVPFSPPEFAQASETAARNGVRLAWGGQYRHSPLYLAFAQQREKAAFGQPVYLRQIGGGGTGLLLAWWAACQALEQGTALLAASWIQLHLAAVRRRNSYHIILSGIAANRATAQLIVTPTPPVGLPELSLLGTGGLISTSSTLTSPLVISRDGRWQCPLSLPLELPWLLDFARQPTSDLPAVPPFPTLPLLLWRTLRQAIRQGEPIPLSLPVLS